MQFLKTFYRQQVKHPVITFLNALGLVLGFLSTMLILEYVFYERSYESHHTKAENVYRLAYDRYQHGNLLWKTANSFYPSGSYLKERFDEVENNFTIIRNYNVNLSFYLPNNEYRSFNVPKTYYATPSIFEVLTFKFTEGDAHCLDAPNQMAISERARKKYFDNQSPIGRVIRVNHNAEFTIVAVFDDLPPNSHIRTDFLFPVSHIINQNPRYINNWAYDYFHSYIQLKEGTDYQKFAQKAFPIMIEENYAENLSSRDMHDDFYLQPLREIHLESNIEYETEKPGSGRAVKILFFFACFFILIAWINYINLVTARMMERAKEVAIKKVNGVNVSTLLMQFFKEAALFNILCLIISLFLLKLINPLYAQFTGIDPGILSNFPMVWVFVGGLFLMGVLLSSIYPAFSYVRYQAVSVLKGTFSSQPHGILLRKFLVGIQFVISLALLIGTFVTIKQVQYLLTKDTGLNYHSKLILTAPNMGGQRDETLSRVEVLRNRFVQHPEINDFTFVSDPPGVEIERWFWGYQKGNDRSTGLAHFRLDVDNNFTDFFKVELLAGRGYREDDLPEQRKIIINQKSLERLGFSEPADAIGKTVVGGGNVEFQIIGVMADFHYKSVKIEPAPIVLTNRTGAKQYMVLDIVPSSDEKLPFLIESCKTEFQEVFGQEPFEYSILEDFVREDLASDRTFSRVFAIFSTQAILIAILGILGLLIISINQKMKEIGVRKVLGARMFHISILLFNSLWWQLVIAVLITLPLTYWFFDRWAYREHFYRNDIQIWMFLLPVLILSSILVMLIFYQAKKAYRSTVVDVLNIE